MLQALNAKAEKLGVSQTLSFELKPSQRTTMDYQ
jgi:hypothetical protein